MTLHERLRQGATVVLDTTNLSPKRRSRHMAVAREYGRPVVAVRFDVPVKELLARNHRRRRQVPPGSIVLMSRRLGSDATAAHLLAEGCVAVHDADAVFAMLDA
jgi:predicted kinase